MGNRTAKPIVRGSAEIRTPLRAQGKQIYNNIKNNINNKYSADNNTARDGEKSLKDN
jgi:hypothetical protein